MVVCEEGGICEAHRVHKVWRVFEKKGLQAMLEQEKQASQVTAGSGVDTEKRTQLEGIRQKVFMDRYSLKDPAGKPLEFYPEQLWARVARGIASVESTEEQQTYWEQRFNEVLTDFQFVPGGRILAGA